MICFDTYRIVKQRMLRFVCTYAQTRLSISCLHLQSVDVEWDSGRNLDTQSHIAVYWKVYAYICDKY